MFAVAKQKPRGDGGEGPREDKDDSRPGRKSAPVQIEKELARMAAVIAAHDGITMSDLLTPVVRQFIITNYERVLREGQAKADRIRQERDES